MVFGQRLLAPREARRRRSKEGSRVRRLSPKKEEEEKKRSQAIEKKTLNHRSLDSTSNQPSLALTLRLEGGKKKKNRKEEGWLSGGWALAQGDERRASRFQGSNSSPLPPFNFEGCSKCGGISRGEEKGRGKTGASRRAWIRVPVCTLTPSLSLSGRNARWSR